jgi:hypothetical protein
MDILSELVIALMDGLHYIPADEAGMLCSLASNKPHIDRMRSELWRGDGGEILIAGSGRHSQ